MKLDAVSVRMLGRAIEIYLQGAYTSTQPPYSVRAKAFFDENEPLEKILASKKFEKFHSRDNGVVTHFLLRLGNERYPHMKLGLASCAGDEEDFVFVVETHDRYFHTDKDRPGGREFRELQVYNDRIKQEIERRWEEANLPTLRQVLESYNPPCALPAGDKTIMIVEDEAPIAELERNILECDGYKVVVCLSGEDAVETAQENRIDLCLLDIMMPDADGFDVVRLLNERRLKRFPVVFVTAMPETRVDTALADGFIAKPFEPQFLLEKVRAYIG